MAEAEFVITGLRTQVRELQSLVNYFESREHITGDDYRFTAQRLQGLVNRLKSLEQYAYQRRDTALQAEWRN